MNNGITIGDNDHADTCEPLARAMAEHIREGTRWQDISERARERLCLTYARECCADTLLTERLEKRIWAWAQFALARHLEYTSASCLMPELVAARSAASAGELAQELADRAVEQCEQSVRLLYLDAWRDAHESDPVERHPPVIGR